MSTAPRPPLSFVKRLVFTGFTVVLTVALVHGVFVLLAWLEGVPRLSFEFSTMYLGTGARNRQNNELVVLPPNSYFRRQLPQGLTFKDENGNTMTHYHGLRRDRPFAVEKPAGVRRVLAVGDSFTWGARLSDHETLPALLERRLTESGERVEVLNAGIVSSTITNTYESLVHYDLRFQPDVVLLTFCDNDIEDLAADTSISPGLYEFLRRTHVFGPVRYIFGRTYQQRLREIEERVYTDEVTAKPGERFGIKREITHFAWPAGMGKLFKNRKTLRATDLASMRAIYYYTHAARIMPETRADDAETWRLWARWEDELGKLKRLGDERGFRLIVHVYPIYARLYETEFDGKRTPEAILREIGAKLGIPVVDPLPAFRAAAARGERLYFYPEDGHPTATGSRVAAEALADPVRAALE